MRTLNRYMYQDLVNELWGDMLPCVSGDIFHTTAAATRSDGSGRWVKVCSRSGYSWSTSTASATMSSFDSPKHGVFPFLGSSLWQVK